MDTNKILRMVDHTLLTQDAMWEEIKTVLDDAIAYGCACACIPPSYVYEAKQYVGERLKICTVIGFPNGYAVTAVKCCEAADAVQSGADEIDMVINIGWLKDKRYDDILNEINSVKKSCSGRLLKVIIETCLLTDEEKIMMCEIVSNSDADFIKTSTGFSIGGATRADVRLFKKHMKNGKKIKAAGGITSLEDAADFIALGAERLGTSRIVKIVKSSERMCEDGCKDTSY